MRLVSQVDKVPEGLSLRALFSFFADIKVLHSVFALPFALATALRPDVIAFISPLKMMLVLVALISARSFAMGFNRYADRDIDALNPRTQGRAIPKGVLSAKNSRTLVLIFAVVFMGASFMLSVLCGVLSPLVLALLAGYSYTKRFTAFCHFYLGFCLGLSPLATEVALTGSLSHPWSCLYLGAGIVFWTAAFDIIYASADKVFDQMKGLYSIPSSIGHAGSSLICALCYATALGFWFIYGTSLNFQAWFFRGLGLVAVIFFGQIIVFAKGFANTPSRVNFIFFWANAAVSLIVLASSLLEGGS